MLRQDSLPTHCMSSTTIRILAVDDHPLLREGVAAAIESQPDMELVAEATNGLDAVRLFRDVRPDVVLMDVRMPGVDGIAALSLILDEFPDAKVIVLTTYPGDAQVMRAIKAGARGYLLKDMLRTELLDALRTVAAGQRRIPSAVAAMMAEHVVDNALSNREVEVLRLVAQGRSNKRVAAELALSEETVKTHMRSILEKLSADDRTHAVTIALRRGIIEL